MNWRWIEAVVVLTILGCIAWLFWPSFGAIHYFSPDTLESGYRPTVAFAGLQPDYRFSLKPTESKLIQFLIERKYWRPTHTPSPRWIVTDYSVRREFNRNADEWVQWSEQHPEYAAALWPRVLDVLRNDPKRGQSDVSELMWEAKNDTLPRRAMLRIP
jgi:hypothetical protein